MQMQMEKLGKSYVKNDNCLKYLSCKVLKNNVFLKLKSYDSCCIQDNNVDMRFILSYKIDRKDIFIIRKIIQDEPNFITTTFNNGKYNVVFKVNNVDMYVFKNTLHIGYTNTLLMDYLSFIENKTSAVNNSRGSFLSIFFWYLLNLCFVILSFCFWICSLF